MQRKEYRLNLFDDTEFLKKLLWLSLPVAAHNFVMSSLNFVDNLMIGQLGDQAVAAIGIAGQVYFLLIVFLFGISSGGGVFMSQYWGARDLKSIKNVMGLSLMAVTGMCLIFTVVGFFYPVSVAQIFSADTEVVELTVSYLRVVSLSFVVAGISMCLSFALRSTERVFLPLVASVISVALNIVLNYGLIFGNLGLPALGVPGAAVATVIARFIEALIIIAVMYGKNYEVASSWDELSGFNMAFLRKFANIAGHVVVHEISWAVGTVTYYWAYSRIGTESLAALNISNAVERIAIVGFMGICHGGGIIIGKTIGENDGDRAYGYSRKLRFLAPAMAILVSLLLLLLTGGILSLYNVSCEVKYLARILIGLLALYFPAKMFNMISLISILRSAGDTRFCFLLESSAVWFIGVPMAFLGLHLGLPVYLVYLMVNTEELFKVFMLLRKFSGNRWIRRVVSDKIPNIDKDCASPAASGIGS